MSAESVAEAIFSAIEKQIALLDDPPTVVRNQAWAERMDSLPLVSLFMEEDENAYMNWEEGVNALKKVKYLTIRMELIIRKVQNESVTWTMFHLAEQITRRLEEQMNIMISQAPALIDISEGNMSEVSSDVTFEYEVAMAEKTYIAQYEVERHD